MENLKKAIKKSPVVNLYRKKRNRFPDISYYKTHILPIIEAGRKNPRLYYWIFTPDFGNIGDQIIALSEYRLLLELGIPFCEIPRNELLWLEKHNMLGILNGHPVLFKGGGYLGTLWYHNEVLLRKILLANPESHMLFFPNTAYYEESNFGNEELKNAIGIYHVNQHLKLYARERYSLPVMEQLANYVSLAPDMAMRLCEDHDASSRIGCGLFLREDLEKTRTIDETYVIISQAELLFPNNVLRLDTVVQKRVDVTERFELVNSLLSKVKSFELVITDRLHGMILGAITGTPTIVVNSKSHKVRGCYEWIKHLNYVQFCENADEITDIYEKMPHGSQKYNNEALLPYYEELRQDLLTIGDREWPRVRKK